MLTKLVFINCFFIVSFFQADHNTPKQVISALNDAEIVLIALKIENCESNTSACIDDAIKFGQSQMVTLEGQRRYQEKLQAMGYEIPLEEIKIEVVEVIEIDSHVQGNTIYAKVKAKVKAVLHDILSNCKWPWVNCYEVEGTDEAGKKASFQLVLLASDFNWEFGSFNSMLFLGRPFDFPGFIRSTEMSETIQVQKVLDIICVGMASSEGIRFEEESRALIRSQNLAHWTKNHLRTERKIPMYILNLGQNMIKQQALPIFTSHQRSILIIGVLGKDKDVDLAGALWDALKDRQFSGFKVSDYSKGKPRLELSRYGGI